MHAEKKPEQEKVARSPHRTAGTDSVTGPASPDFQPMSTQALLALQRAVGNAAVARLVAVWRNAADPRETGRSPVPPSTVHDVLRSPGRPLTEPLRTEMEGRLSADLSDVRLHTDTAARRSAAEVGARAYTSGRHVVVGADGGDRHTLAHELTHVIQQRDGPVTGTVRHDGLAVSDPGDAFERAAETNARRVMSGKVPAMAPRPSGHPRSAAATVQRMQLADFQQHVNDDQSLTGQVADFITFFELRRAQLDPGAVVADPAAGSQARLRQFVETDEVDIALVDEYIAAFALGAAGTRTPSRRLDDPHVAGLEIELASVVLNVSPDTEVHNGDLLGATTAMTPVGLPTLKLEIEGMDRLNEPDRRSGDRVRASVELIYGPLTPTAYSSRGLLSARAKLKQAISKRADRATSLNDLLLAYNNSLTGPEQVYRLNLTTLPTSLTKPVSTGWGSNTQTNISTSYGKLGATPTTEDRDFVKFFDARYDQQMYGKARTVAADLAGQIDTNWTDQHPDAQNLAAGSTMRSLLTQILFQEAKYLYHAATLNDTRTMNRHQVQPGDKHHFHVLLKLSPQDAVMSIIGDDDARRLLAWLVDKEVNGADILATAAITTFSAASRPSQSASVDATEVYNYLVQALLARLLAGRQLLEVKDQGQQSRVFGSNRQVGDLTHFHPRPSARVPITVNNDRYYMVVEQRKGTHRVNTANPGHELAIENERVSQIRNLQR